MNWAGAAATIGCFAAVIIAAEIWTRIEHRRQYGTWSRRPDRVYRTQRNRGRWS